MYLWCMVITDEGIRIDVPIVDSLHRRDVELEECYLKLYEGYLEYKVVYIAEADDFNDFEGIWKPVRSNYRFTRARKDLTEVSMYFDNPEDKWMVSVEFKGVSGSTGWLFDTPKEAKRVYDQLAEYFITRPNL